MDLTRRTFLRSTGLGALGLGISTFKACTGEKSEQSIETFHIVLSGDTTSVLKNIASIMERQISQRCNARPSSGDSAQLSIELMIDHNLGSETFQIFDGKAGVIRIIGGDERGVLYGVGKFLRTSRYDLGGFALGQWRGMSAPECPVRAVYLATHFNNFYMVYYLL